MLRTMNNREKNSYVRGRSIEALQAMIGEQEFGSITVSALTERAGGGRATFYRNFDSKEDVLRQESERLTGIWRLRWERQSGSADNFLVSLLDFYKEHTPFYLALYRAGLFQMVLDDYLRWSKITSELPNAAAYLKSALAYLTYGWVVEWAHRGMRESGTELAGMISESQQKRSRPPPERWPRIARGCAPGGAKEALYEQEPGEPQGFAWLSFGGPEETRTLDLSDANRTLSHAGRFQRRSIP